MSESEDRKENMQQEIKSSDAGNEQSSSKNTVEEEPSSKAIQGTINKETKEKKEKKEKIDDKLNDEVIEEILQMKLKINTLIANIRDTKTLCDKYDTENQYLQDYVGNLMQTEELK